jgi:secretory phospholipase A2
MEGLEGLASLFGSLGGLDLGDNGGGGNGGGAGRAGRAGRAGGAARRNKKRRGDCPKGQVRVPKELDSLLEQPRRNQYIANGCGPEGMQVEEPFGLWQCCNGHDVCYSTCGAKFGHCESEFGRCMKGVCDRLESPERQRECHEQASGFTGMTGIFGRGSHASSQRDTCECKTKGPEADAAWRAFIEAVYAKSGAAQGMGQDMPAVEAMLPGGQLSLGEASASEDAVGALLKAWEGKEGELAFAMVRRYGVYFVKATGSTPLAFIGRDNETVYEPKVTL